jgi:hypothetical protein
MPSTAQHGPPRTGEWLHPPRRAVNGAPSGKAVGEQALAIVRSFRKRGRVEQIGIGRGMRWKLAGQ